MFSACLFTGEGVPLVLSLVLCVCVGGGGGGGQSPDPFQESNGITQNLTNPT